MAATLAGKVALVTGASSGIGEAAALALAAAGAWVAISGRRTANLAALAERIAAAGGRALALPGDVAVEAEATKSVEDTVARLGRIDILVNSAGVNEAGGVEALSLDKWRKVIDINLMGTLYTCAAAFPHMKAQGGGDIVNISSTSGRIYRKPSSGMRRPWHSRVHRRARRDRNRDCEQHFRSKVERRHPAARLEGRGDEGIRHCRRDSVHRALAAARERVADIDPPDDRHGTDVKELRCPPT